MEVRFLSSNGRRCSLLILILLMVLLLRKEYVLESIIPSNIGQPYSDADVATSASPSKSKRVRIVQEMKALALRWNQKYRPLGELDAGGATPTYVSFDQYGQLTNNLIQLASMVDYVMCHNESNYVIVLPKFITDSLSYFDLSNLLTFFPIVLSKNPKFKSQKIQFPLKARKVYFRQYDKEYRRCGRKQMNLFETLYAILSSILSSPKPILRNSLESMWSKQLQGQPYVGFHLRWLEGSCIVRCVHGEKGSRNKYPLKYEDADDNLQKKCWLCWGDPKDIAARMQDLSVPDQTLLYVATDGQNKLQIEKLTKDGAIFYDEEYTPANVNKAKKENFNSMLDLLLLVHADYNLLRPSDSIQSSFSYVSSMLNHELHQILNYRDGNIEGNLTQLISTFYVPPKDAVGF